MGSCQQACVARNTSFSRFDSEFTAPDPVFSPSYTKTADMTMTPKFMYSSGPKLSSILKGTTRDVTILDVKTFKQSRQKTLLITGGSGAQGDVGFLSEVENISSDKPIITAIRQSDIHLDGSTIFKRQLTSFKTHTSRSRTKKLASLQEGFADHFETVGVDDMSFAVDQHIKVIVKTQSRIRESGSRTSRDRSKTMLDD